MAESAKDNKTGPKRAGAADAPVSALRFPAELTQKIDDWAARKAIGTRAEAIARLVELGLSVKRPHGKRSESQRARAKDMAGSVIDGMTDASAGPEDNATRKRRLLRGPEEFRQARTDRQKNTK